MIGEEIIVCPECNCNKAFYNPVENHHECPCGHIWDENLI